MPLRQSPGGRFCCSAAVLAVVGALGCDTPSDRPTPAQPVSPEMKTPSSPSPPQEPEVSAPPAPRKHGAALSKLPVEHPAVATTAAAGDYVLVPPREWIDEALERGADAQAFVFYAARLSGVGEKASEVTTLLGTKMVIPNATIIALRPAQEAKPGDVVLTWWQTGSGMQRALVVEGGSPAQPKVRYLDIPLDSPTGWGGRADTLAKGSFHVLKTPGEPGTTVACQDGEKRLREIVVNRAGDRLLVVGFAGRLAARSRADCVSVPIKPKVAEGDTAYVPRLGRFQPATVSRVDASIGRVFVKIGDEKAEAFAYTNVAERIE